MMWRAACGIAVLSICLALSGAVAAEVPIRSVEHPDYSRLVVPLATGDSWEMTRIGNKYRITLTGPATVLSAAGVFDRIPRTRILAVVPFVELGQTGFDVTLGCSCEATASRIGAGLLAIDIRRSTSGGSSGGTLLTGNRSFIPSAVTPAGARTGDAPAAPAATTTSSSADSAQTAPLIAGDPEALRPPLEDERAQLIDELRRVADAGLLNLVPQPDALPQPESTAEVPTPAPVTAEVRDVAPGSPMAQLQLRTALDNVRAQEILPPVVADHCGDQTILAMAGWTSDLPFAERLGDLNRTLINDLNVSDPAIALQLAQFYLGYGFGAEAAAVLHGFAVGTDTRPVLGEIAAVLEGEQVAIDGPLAVATGCGGRVGMWRAAAGFGLDLVDGHLPVDFVVAVSELPPYIRRIVGGLISTHLIDVGADAAAIELLEILERAPGPATPEQALNGARLERGTGAISKTHLAELETLVVEPTAVSHLALLEQALSILDQGRPLGTGKEADLAIEMRGFRGQPAGLRMTLLLARAYAMRGDPAASLDLLVTERRFYPRSQAPISDAARTILLGLAENETDVLSLMRTVLHHKDFLQQDRESQAIRSLLARRISQSGLPNLAFNLMREDRALPNPDVRMIRAATLVQQGRFDEALEVLGNLTGIGPDSGRVAALSGKTDYAGAFAMLQDRPAADPDRTRLALLSGNWSAALQGTLRQPVKDFAIDYLNSGAEANKPTDAGVQADDAPTPAVAGSTDGAITTDLSLASVTVMLENSRKLRALAEAAADASTGAAGT